MRTLLVGVVALAASLAATGCKSGGTPSPTSTVQGREGARLTIEKPHDVTLMQGDSAQVTVTIRRDNLDGPVTISFHKLPDGVSVVGEDRKIVGEAGTFILRAGDKADLVSGYSAEVTAKGPGGIAATELLKINIKTRE